MKNIKLILITSVLLAVAVSGLARSAEDVQIPFELGKGQMLYEKYCSACHGVQLSGTDKGPPLIHPFYKPSHHGDRAFYNAALKGTRQHHWEFGDMLPVEGMTPKKMDSLVPFVRYYQKQKGLY
jgi:cytochrome c2